VTIHATQTTTSTDVLAGLREIFATGRTRPLEWRLKQLRGVQRFVEERESEIAAALADDLGRSAVEAWLGDIASTKGEAVYALKHVKK
jgi:aldehyde dehydrogenase (NAD+)